MRDMNIALQLFTNLPLTSKYGKKPIITCSLTTDNLRTRHVVMINWCCICKRNGESVYHLFHCDIASPLWHDFFGRVGLVWVTPKRIEQLFNFWEDWHLTYCNNAEDGSNLPHLVYLE